MNYPFAADECSEGVPMERDQSYYRQRRIEEAHQVIESLKDTRREPPLEVQQAHRIGTLEAELRNTAERALEEHHRAESLEGAVKAQADNILSLESWSSSYQKEIRALRHELETAIETIKKLKSRKKTAVKKK